jgi:hypothetical protein
MRTKLLLIASFVLAVLIFASSAAGASGKPSAPAPTPQRVFTIFHQTWCVGEVSPVTPCDVTIGESGIHRTGTHATLDSSPSPIDRLRGAVRAGTNTLVLSPLDKALRLEELLRASSPARR